MAQCGRSWTHLKSDHFGRVERGHSTDAAPEDGLPQEVVRRDTRAAPWWTRPLARYLAGREARSLRTLEERLPDMAGSVLPRLCRWQGGVLVRSWIPGAPMQEARPTDPAYHHALLVLLARLHFAGIVHNDLAKEPNFLVRPDGSPALVDLQLARAFRKRGAWFRLHAREDLRHLLKHKRTYLEDRLTPRELGILATPSLPARLWRRTGKKVYLWITRGLLGWSDREGAGDRDLTSRP
ncbi:MAG: serine/threonine protein kinase [Planctomycetota bacterium]